MKLLQHRGKEAEETHFLEREKLIATATLELEQLVVAAREQRARAAEAQQLELRREQLHTKLVGSEFIIARLSIYLSADPLNASLE